MKLSIGIPTRERADTLRATLRTLAAIDDPDLEIILSDNASTDDTARVAREAGDPRIVYVNPGRRVSQRQNFEHALRAATGEYVMLIGDDDAVLPAQWPLLRSILAGGRPEALSWPALFYQWPAPHKRAGGGLLRLRRGLVHGAAIARKGADHLQSIAMLERTREDFSPRLYHGFLSRAVIERLRAKTGDVVMSGQVDAYIAAAASAVIERYLYVRHPFTILAMGPRSGGSSVLEQFLGRTGNDALEQVAREGEDDPVREPIEGPFPSLGFYLLAGYEQARRKIAGDALPLDHTRYFDMILAQLAIVPEAARTRGIAILRDLAAGAGDGPGLDAAIAAHPRKPARSAPRIEGYRAALTRWVEGLSHLAPDRVVLDMKSRPGRGSVDAAASMADRIIGRTDWAPEDASRRWRGVQLRALRAMLRL